MKNALPKGQKLIGSFQMALPKGDTLEIEVITQKDGGVCVTQYYRKKGQTGPGIGETCFYCGGKKIKCVTCKPGERFVGDCVNKTAMCEPMSTSH